MFLFPHPALGLLLKCGCACGVALRMFGYTKRDMIGQNINEIIPEPIATVHQQYLSLFVRTGHEVRDGTPVTPPPSCKLSMHRNSINSSMK